MRFRRPLFWSILIMRFEDLIDDRQRKIRTTEAILTLKKVSERDDIKPLLKAVAEVVWGYDPQEVVARATKNFNAVPTMDTAPKSFYRRAVLLRAVKHLPYQTVTCVMGFECGRALWKNVKDAETLPEPPATGRKCADPKKVKKAEEAISHIAAGRETRVYFGTQKSHAQRIAQRTGYSMATAAKYMEATPATKAVDLCDVCEALRDLRIGKLREGTCPPPAIDTLGQRQIKTLHTAAASPSSDLIQHLEKHETHASSRKRAYENDWKDGGIVLVADFMGAVEMTSNRGTSWEFYNKQTATISVLGVATRKQKYNVLDVQKRRHTGELTGRLILTAFEKIEKLEMWEPGTQITIWLDAGLHFRSKAFLYVVLSSKYGTAGKIKVRFHAEGHGKSICDSHFSHMRRVLKCANLTECKDVFDTSLWSVAPGETIFVAADYELEHAKLQCADLTCVYDLEMSKSLWERGQFLAEGKISKWSWICEQPREKPEKKNAPPARPDVLSLVTRVRKKYEKRARFNSA